ncbi:hypothetical protein [Agarilytica rhodophyticola]|uniref:hypothetical protein n=1 Tax=Agarilytica rhodophyticola TaxID=1737490 RepID=UPI000B34719C|nr:hypothetical protein [Agarilytica rhodophyticola]
MKTNSEVRILLERAKKTREDMKKNIHDSAYNTGKRSKPIGLNMSLVDNKSKINLDKADKSNLIEANFSLNKKSCH